MSSRERIHAVVLTWILILALIGPGDADTVVNELKLESQAAVLMEYTSGELVYARNPDRKMAPASITKIMTMYLVFEALKEGRIDLQERVVASRHAHSMGGSQIWLEVGEEMTVEDLLFAVAVGSANDASVALAEHISGSEEAFVEKMNERAYELGLKNTRFTNVHGLPINEDEHYMSARDVAVLSREAIRRFPEMLDMTSAWEYYLRDGEEDDSDRQVWLVNFNRLLILYPGTDGLKTGYTDRAGYCLAATASRQGMRFIAVVMKAPDDETRNEEVVRLMDHGFRLYRMVEIVQPGETVASVPVNWGHVSQVQIQARKPLSVTIRRDREVQLKPQIRLQEDPLRAPLQTDEPLGELVVVLDGERGAAVDLYPDRAVRRVGVGGIMGQVLEGFLRTLLEF